MTIDVRAVLAGNVWPENVHDFSGDNLDIFDEQVAPLDDADRRDAALQILHLLGDPDLVIRSYAVLALCRAKAVVGEPEVRAAIAHAAEHLDVPGAPMRQVHHATLLEEAEYRLQNG
jgi:hypothetical protein